MQAIRLTYHQIDHLIKKEKSNFAALHGSLNDLFHCIYLKVYKNTKRIQNMIFIPSLNPHVNKNEEDNNCIYYA